MTWLDCLGTVVAIALLWVAVVRWVAMTADLIRETFERRDGDEW